MTITDASDMARPDAATLERILAAGLLAPSAENCHYVRFAVGAESVELMATDHASWERYPHREMLARLAYGAILENMALASVPLGWEMLADTAWVPDQAARIAVLRWRRSRLPVDALSSALDKRHTNRRFFRRQRPAAELLAAMKAAAQTIPGTSLHWLDEPVVRSTALRLIRVAETERFRRRELHRELFSALRFEAGWRRSTSEWLPLGALEVEWPMRPLFAWLRHWPIMRAATLVGGHAMLGFRAGYLPCVSAPSLGLITTRATPLAHAGLSAGRALQRAWLAATVAGLAFQPFAACTALSRQKPGDGWVSDDGSRVLKQGLSTLIEATEPGEAYMLFRVGLAKAPTLVTGRPPVSDYLS